MNEKKLSPKEQEQEKTLWYRCMRLKNHLDSCAHCSGADKAELHARMCFTGIALTIRVAEKFDFIIDLNRRVDLDKMGIIHACPDPELHGQSYGLLAEPLRTVAVDEKLF